MFVNRYFPSEFGLWESDFSESRPYSDRCESFWLIWCVVLFASAYGFLRLASFPPYYFDSYRIPPILWVSVSHSVIPNLNTLLSCLLPNLCMDLPMALWKLLKVFKKRKKIGALGAGASSVLCRQWSGGRASGVVVSPLCEGVVWSVGALLSSVAQIQYNTFWGQNNPVEGCSRQRQDKKQKKGKKQTLYMVCPSVLTLQQVVVAPLAMESPPKNKDKQKTGMVASAPSSPKSRKGPNPRHEAKHSGGSSLPDEGCSHQNMQGPEHKSVLMWVYLYLPQLAPCVAPVIFPSERCQLSRLGENLVENAVVDWCLRGSVRAGLYLPQLRGCEHKDFGFLGRVIRLLSCDHRHELGPFFVLDHLSIWFISSFAITYIWSTKSLELIFLSLLFNEPQSKLNCLHAYWNACYPVSPLGKKKRTVCWCFSLNSH